jgi:hypothetical protein
MSISKNSAGFENILEISLTSDISYTAGVFKPVKYNAGFKIKSAVTGTIKVHYQGDPADRFIDLVISSNDVNVWLSDRINQIIEDGTDIAAASLIAGW